MASRLDSVLEAIDGTYATDCRLVSGTTLRDSLAGEAYFRAVTHAERLRLAQAAPWGVPTTPRPPCGVAGSRLAWRSVLLPFEVR